MRRLLVFTFFIAFFSISQVIYSQVLLTNATPSMLIDFSNSTPSSIGTTPQSAFTGAGFSPDPTSAGRLNSNAWSVTGWTDGALIFGGTNATGDYARGAVSAAQTTGGMYAYTGVPGSASNPTLMIQPGGSDFAPGTLTLKIQNQGTTNITDISIAYNLYVRNDQGRSNSFNFSHSGDNVSYTPVAALDYTSPATADAAGWVLVGSAPSRATNISGLNIAPNGVYYLRWSSADIGGSGSRDEFGLDDINITASFLTSTITYYPRTTATDLSLASQWTDDPSGLSGNSPINFSSPNQLFNLSNNVSNPMVNGSWTISGGSNLILNNTNSLVFTPSASFALGSGSAADFSNRPVTLQSNATATAFVGMIAGTLSNANNVTVERFISSTNNRAYRLLAPSVNSSSSIRNNWQENGNNVPGFGTHITGSTTGANGFDASQTGQGSLFTYDAVTPAWQYISNTDINTLDAKKGYLLYVRGDRTIDLNSTASPLPSNNTIVRATGTLLTGPQSFAGLAGNNGFSLITNPYAASINWPNVYGASTGLTQFYTLWDPNIGSQGGYVTVNTAGIKSNPGSNATTNIQSGQAFFIQASGASSPVVNVLETHKSSANNIDVFRLGTHTELFTSSLFYTDQFGNRVNADGVTSVFDNSYDKSVDGNDASQIANWDEDIAILRDNNSLSIESRPLIDARDTIPFAMARMQVRNYEWQFSASGFNHPDLSASLVDNFLNNKTSISLSGATVISFSVTNDPASSAANRFSVIFGPNAALPVNISAVKAYQKGKDIQVEWITETETNLDSYTVEKSFNGRDFTKAYSNLARGGSSATAYEWLDVNVHSGSNYYRIKAISKTGEVQYSKVMRVTLDRAVNEIIVYPNPVKGEAFALGINLPSGLYTVTLINISGQEVYKKQIVHTAGAATQTFQIGRRLVKGIYQLTVSDGKNNYVQKLVKE